MAKKGTRDQRRPGTSGKGRAVVNMEDLLIDEVAKAVRIAIRNNSGIHVCRPPLKVKVVIYENEGGGFTAEVPALRGCVTEAVTREELLTNLREAIEGSLLAGSGTYQARNSTGVEEEIEL
jgi:hypothetical protein